jgi:PAS domain S-box-containing protein
MKQHSDDTPDWNNQRMQIIGLGESSIRKSYYPELQEQHTELLKKNEELQVAYEELTAINEELTANYDKLSESERKLRESEERYRTIIETTDTGFVVTDDEGKIFDANIKYIHLTGHQDLAEILNRNLVEWTAINDKEKNNLAIRRCIRDGFIRNLEVDYVDSFGNLTPIEINSTCVKMGPGVRILSLCRDISDRKQDEKILELARKKLNLLNTVTFQDIQSAIFTLSAYLELTKNALTDEKAISYLEKEVSLIQVIASSIKFGRDYQDMGMKPPRWQRVNHVFLYAISHLDFLQISRHVDLEGLEIYADPLLEKVLFNLMDNVIQHGETVTEVTLRYQKRADDLVLIIEDNGIGIPLEKKRLLFERGFGKESALGLFLVREILSITGITISETGVEGMGARFEILVPANAYRFSLDSDR